MDNKKNDKYFVEQAIEQIAIIDNYIGNKTYEEFMSDDKLVDAIMFRLVQMIENIKNVSIEFKENNSQIPWGKIMGFRTPNGNPRLFNCRDENEPWLLEL